jgi:GNAT superfamily N-acetyltransferase
MLDIDGSRLHIGGAWTRDRPRRYAFDGGRRRWSTGWVEGLTIRTAVPADLPALRHVYRDASLSNAGDAPRLLARPEYLVFAGDGIPAGRTRVAETGRILGFATVTPGQDDGPELEDLFVDPAWRRLGIARQLVQDAVRTARQAGHRRLWVTGNQHALDFYRAAGFVPGAEVATELGTGLRMYLPM